MNKDKYYGMSIEEICHGMDGNIPSAWKAFVEKVTNDSYHKREGYFNYSKDKEEDFRDVISKVIYEFCKHKARLLETRINCHAIFAWAVNRFKLRAQDFYNRTKGKVTEDIEQVNNVTYNDPVNPDFTRFYEKVINENLNDKEKLILRLDQEGYNNQEVADKVGTSVGYVRTSLYRIREKIKILKKY